MKSYTLFLILFIIKLSVSQSELDNYSIDSFIDNLKDEGLFDIIYSIKYSYGQDVAIISCEELSKNNSVNCKKVVLEYMPCRPTRSSMVNIDTILMRKFPLIEAKLIAKRIIKRVEKFNNK